MFFNLFFSYLSLTYSLTPASSHCFSYSFSLFSFFSERRNKNVQRNKAPDAPSPSPEVPISLRMRPALKMEMYCVPKTNYDSFDVSLLFLVFIIALLISVKYHNFLSGNFRWAQAVQIKPSVFSLLVSLALFEVFFYERLHSEVRPVSPE